MKAKIKIMFLPLEMYCLLEVDVAGPSGETIMQLNRLDSFTITSARPIKLLGEHPNGQEVMEDVARELVTCGETFVTMGEEDIDGARYHNANLVQ